MYFAFHPETGELIPPQKNTNGVCPMCKTIVISKCGEIVAHHWAHKSLKDCDTWGEGETNWHLEWKSLYRDVEVTINRAGEKHRADAINHEGIVIEFQHSPISLYDVRKRELFYDNMIWIFDAREYLHRFHRLGYQKDDDGNEFIHFRCPNKTVWRYCSKPVLLDFGKKHLLLFHKLKYWGRLDRGWGRWVEKEMFLFSARLAIMFVGNVSR